MAGQLAALPAQLQQLALDVPLLQKPNIAAVLALRQLTQLRLAANRSPLPRVQALTRLTGLRKLALMGNGRGAKKVVPPPAAFPALREYSAFARFSHM